MKRENLRRIEFTGSKYYNSDIIITGYFHAYSHHGEKLIIHYEDENGNLKSLYEENFTIRFLD